MVQSKDAHIIPVFIDEKTCNLQLLLSSDLMLTNPTLQKVNPFDLKESQDQDLAANSYLLKDQNANLNEINFVPYKAYQVI